MRYLKLLILIPLLLCSCSSFANQILFDQANGAFENEDYEEALSLYKQLETSYPNQYELHFNLGNTYYHLDSLALSILHFEKTLKYDPGNERALHNLQLCYLKSDYSIEPLPKVFFTVWWEKYLAYFSLNSWSKLTISTLWLSILLFFVNYLKNNDTIKFFAFSFLMMGFALIFTTSRKSKVLDSQTHAIVVMSALPLQEGPNADSEEILVLHEGMKVQLLDSVDNWIQVKIDEDTDGWVNRNGLVTI